MKQALAAVAWEQMAADWLLREAPLGLLITDFDLTIVAWNRWLETRSGRSAAEMVGRNLLEAYPEIVERGLERYYRDALAGRVQVLSQYFHHHLLPMPSTYQPGPEQMAQTAQIIPLTQDDQVVGTLTFIIDVTERVAREQMLMEINRRLEESLAELQAAQARIVQQERLAAVGQLTAGLAHHLNNILAGMLLATDLLLHSPSLPDPAHDRLTRIKDLGQRAAHLVQQLLDFSGKSLYRLERFDLGLLLREIIRDLERTLPPLIRIRRDIEPGAYPIRADAAQIRRVVSNLIDNARDAMPEGGILTFRLSPLRLRPGQTPPLPDMPPRLWWVLSISDTGVGIPPEVLPRVFEPFFSTKGMTETTGLGLTQAYGIVRQHHGHIVVTSQVGEGTTVTLYLPAAQEERKEEEKEAGWPCGHGETLLLVDGDEFLLDTTRMLLEELGYRVLTARNSREALTLGAQHGEEIALAVIDAMLLTADGTPLYRTLRQRIPGLETVLLSHFPRNAGLDPRAEEGVRGWVVKPFTVEQLAQAVQAALPDKVVHGEPTADPPRQVKG